MAKVIAWCPAVHEQFRAELLRLTGVAALTGLFGWVSQAWGLSLLIGLGGYVLWQLYQIWLLEEWLAGGSGEGLTGVWRSVAERIDKVRSRARQRKKRLSRLLHRFHDTLETMPDAAVILDRRLRVQWFNSAAQSLLGLDPGQADGRRSLPDLLDDPSLAKWLRKGAEAPPLGRRLGQPRERELELRVAPFAKDQLLLTAHDVTELKRVQTVRRDFIANVSHELRTPLTVVMGYLEMLAREDLPQEVHDALAASLRQAERMQRLVADLLMLSRLELEDDRPPAEPVNVPRLLEHLLEDARRLDGGQHPLSLHLETRDGLLGSESELTSAFGNLVFNAILHTPPGTPVALYWEPHEDGLRFCVRDQGPGIPPEHLDRLTERFYRVDKSRSRERGGTGLGLSIVRHVLLRHDATIEIESRIGEGSRFCCIFAGERVAPASHSVASGGARERP